MMVSKIISHHASVFAQNKRECVRVLDRRACSKCMRRSSPASLSGSSTTFPLHVWGDGRDQGRVIVLEVRSHTFQKNISDCCLATGMFSPLQEKSWN